MAQESPLITYGKYGALGFEFAGAIVAGLLIGNYADTQFGTAPPSDGHRGDRWHVRSDISSGHRAPAPFCP